MFAKFAALLLQLARIVVPNFVKNKDSRAKADAIETAAEVAIAIEAQRESAPANETTTKGPGTV
jgi:hypothetical protein